MVLALDVCQQKLPIATVLGAMATEHILGYRLNGTQTGRILSQCLQVLHQCHAVRIVLGHIGNRILCPQGVQIAALGEIGIGFFGVPQARPASCHIAQSHAFEEIGIGIMIQGGLIIVNALIVLTGKEEGTHGLQGIAVTESGTAIILALPNDVLQAVYSLYTIA